MSAPAHAAATGVPRFHPSGKHSTYGMSAPAPNVSF